MNDYDPLYQSYPYDNEITKRTAKCIGLLILAGFLIFVLLFTLTTGCMSIAKEQASDIYYNWGATPTPTPTPEITTAPPTPEPTPTPAPTIDIRKQMLRTNGHYMREWAHWFRPDVEGIRPGPEDTGDLSSWVTVYGYKLLPSYHWYSVSWARNFLVRPEDRNNQFLFFFVNEYIDEYSTRQFGFDCQHFGASYKGRMYYPDPLEYPERRITEFDEIQNYGRTESMKPFGYKIVQEKGTGIISSERQEFLFAGRSNAWDGYCIVEIPHDAKPEEISIYGSFANLGGTHWWQLEENQNI